ncbi:TIGR04206 family protein [Halegenticoccus tardaugens]|uniref:TIGR04206 family protein n=1 Tax=Halegenticoccus tardaugens TaxID=2071624 RepID=UPI00100BBB78|nr:TIGR04206 family protein [Halegenticoccus tardaugens]
MATTTARSASGPAAVLAILSLSLLPWTVLGGGDVTFVMPWGLVNPRPLHVFTIVEYFADPRMGYATLPRSLQAWPLALLMYLLALASASVGLATGREDRRVTAGLLVIAGVASLSMTAGFLRRGAPVAVPLGTGALWIAAWWFYWPALRRSGGVHRGTE